MDAQNGDAAPSIAECQGTRRRVPWHPFLRLREQLPRLGSQPIEGCRGNHSNSGLL